MAQKNKADAKAKKPAQASKARKTAKPAVKAQKVVRPAKKVSARVKSPSPPVTSKGQPRPMAKSVKEKPQSAGKTLEGKPRKDAALTRGLEPRKPEGVAKPHGKAPAAAVVASRTPVPHTGARTVSAAVTPPQPKITAPVKPAARPVPMTPKQLAEKAAQQRQAAVQAAAQQQAAAAAQAPKKPVSQRHGFKTNEYIVYPSHGVGRIVGIEEQEIAGMSLELFVITFDKEKLTLRVPTGKLSQVGMRKLADEDVVKKAMETLKGRARVKRTMWSRRAQEYVAKINSGDLVSIAEVVRDLYRSEAQPEQSYSERQLYEDALDRMAREIAAVDRLDERGAVQRITEVLTKSAKGRRLAEGESAETSNEVKAA